jgi:hypothetical protein
MNSSRESMDLGISQTGKNTAYSRIRANNHIVMSEYGVLALKILIYAFQNILYIDH